MDPPVSTAGNHVQPSTAELNDCEVEQVWSLENGLGFNAPRYFTVGAQSNVVLVANGSGTPGVAAISIRDGEHAFIVNESWVRGTTDSRWTIRADIVQDHTGSRLVLGPILESDRFWSVDLDPGISHTAVRVAQNGERVLLASCAGREVQLQSFAGATGRLETSMRIETDCPMRHLMSGALVRMSADGLTVAFASRWGGDLVVADLLQGTHDVVVQAGLGVDEDGEAAPRNAQIINFDLRPDGERLVAVSEDGRIHQWHLSDMTDPEEIGLAKISHLTQRSYMPSSEAPMAFSRDGRLFAYLNGDGDVVIVKTDTQEIVSVMDGPTFRPSSELDHFGNTGQEALGLQFLDDNSGVIGAYTGGLTLWRCTDAAAVEGHDRLGVHLTGPQVVALGEEIEFTATHIGGAAVHGHAFFIDGVELPNASTGRRISWVADEVGVHSIEVEVRDGLNTGRARLMVQVVQ